MPSARRSERLLRPLGALVVCLIVGVPLAVMVAGALNPPGDPLPRGLGIVPVPPSTESIGRAADLSTRTPPRPRARRPGTSRGG